MGNGKAQAERHTVDSVALKLTDLANHNGAARQMDELKPAIEALWGLEGQGVIGTEGPLLDEVTINSHLGAWSKKTVVDQYSKSCCFNQFKGCKNGHGDVDLIKLV